jgi:predicted nucleic acid-binding protein
MWISASAMQHGLKVLTTDKHYLEVAQILTEYVEAGNLYPECVRPKAKEVL